MFISREYIHNLAACLDREHSRAPSAATDAATFSMHVQSNARPMPFGHCLSFAICACILLMYIRASRNDSPNASNNQFAYSSEVYASISRPLLLLRSIGSSLISTPGPIGLEFLCPGKTCSQYVSRLHGLHPSLQISTSFRSSDLLPGQPLNNRQILP